ncbi:MAG: hypothetical protein RLW61_10830 [Gammaproteobacteria bacterium]
MVESGIGGCGSLGRQASDIVFVPHRHSAHVDGERVELELVFHSHFKESRSEPVSARAEVAGLPAVVAPILVGAAFDQVGNAIEAESKRYVATYKGAASSHRFEDGEKTLAGIEFVRRIGTDANVAMRFCAVVRRVAGEEQFFYLEPFGLEFNYSKVKVVALDWLSPFGIDLLNPWEILTDRFSDSRKTGMSNDHDIDLTLEVSFDNLVYSSSSKKVETVSLGSNQIRFRDVPVAGVFAKQGSGLNGLKADRGEAFQAASEQAAQTRVAYGSVGNRALIFSVPQPSSSGSSAQHFSVTVTATEIDDFGSRIKELSEQFESNREGLQKAVLDAFSAP